MSRDLRDSPHPYDQKGIQKKVSNRTGQTNPQQKQIKYNKRMYQKESSLITLLGLFA